MHWGRGGLACVCHRSCQKCNFWISNCSLWRTVVHWYFVMADFPEATDGPTSFFRRIRKGVTDTVMRPIPGGVRVVRAPDSTQGATNGSFGNSKSSTDQANSSSTPPPRYYRLEQFDNILGGENIDLAQLRKLSWNGVPPQYRTMVWQLLLEYLPTNKRLELWSSLQ